MYLVFFCFKKPVKSENEIEILLPLIRWCESIHNKLQSLTTFSSDTNSRLRSLLLVSIAECLPRSNHESTYLVGSKRGSGGPTNLINKVKNCLGSFQVAGARFQCGDMICDGKIANGPTSTLARR